MDIDSYLSEFRIPPIQYNTTITNNNLDNNITTQIIPILENVTNFLEIQVETNNNVEVELSSWRRLLEQELTLPSIRRRYVRVNSSSDEEDNLSFDSTSGLLVNNSDNTNQRLLIEDNVTWTQTHENNTIVEEYRNEEIYNNDIFEELLNEFTITDITDIPLVERENSLRMYNNVIEYISPRVTDYDLTDYDLSNYQVTHDQNINDHPLNTPNLIITSNSVLINFLSDDDADTEVD
jgi:hypothetical protein